MYILTATLTSHSPVSLPLLGSPYSLSHKNIESMSVSKSTNDCTCSSERKRHMSLALNQKLEMMRFSEKGISKANIGRKLSLLHQTAKLSAKGKVFEKSATLVIT